jgi:hypothetical protein
MALYALVGAGSAVFVIVRPPPMVSSRWIDALLLFAFWPFYGPLLLSGARSAGTSCEVGFLAALRRATGTPLSAFLPDAKTALALARRLRVASDKVVEIDELLRRPEFDEELAWRRKRELEAQNASGSAVATAGFRIQNIQHLRRLRDGFARELVEVEELLAQLATQAEVVRLAGVADTESRDLVREILARVEGLDTLLEEEPELGLGQRDTNRLLHRP